MKKVLVSGSVAYDTIMAFDGVFSDHIVADRLNDLNIGFTISQLRKSGGGTAHNIAYTLGLLGYKDQTIMLAAVGKDFNIDEHLSAYISYGHIYQDTDLFTASAYITTDIHHNQITSFYPGAMNSGDKQTIPDQEIAYAMISPQSKSAMMAHLQQAQSKHIPCFFDPGQAMTLFSGEELIQCLSYANYLICNAHEFAMLQEKIGRSEQQIKASLDKIIITLGKDGVRLLSADTEHTIPGIVIDHVIDPTGAGDSFRGGLLAGLLAGASWEDAAKMGNITASYCIAVSGTLNHTCSLQDVEKKLHEIYGQ